MKLESYWQKAQFIIKCVTSKCYEGEGVGFNTRAGLSTPEKSLSVSHNFKNISSVCYLSVVLPNICLKIFLIITLLCIFLYLRTVLNLVLTLVEVL